MEISSIPGKGSTFEVFLPVCDSKPPGNFDMIRANRSCNGDEKILFADDEEILAEMIRDSLESYGYDVTIFSDSLEVLEHFKEHPDDYDIIISDITMPGMTGDLLVKEFRLIRPEIPVIVCTGFSERITENWVDMMQVNALLYKPVPAEEMALTIRTILDAESCG